MSGKLDNKHGQVAGFVYDSAGQVLSVSNFYSDDSLISRFTYLYDPIGNRTQEAREEGTLRTWKYDATSQLCGH